MTFTVLTRRFTVTNQPNGLLCVTSFFFCRILWPTLVLCAFAVIHSPRRPSFFFFFFFFFFNNKNHSPGLRELESGGFGASPPPIEKNCRYCEKNGNAPTCRYCEEKSRNGTAAAAVPAIRRKRECRRRRAGSARSD